MRQQSIFRHPKCFRHFLPLTQEKCGERLIPLCLCHVSSLKSTYAALLIVRQCAGHTSKYAEVSFSLLGASSPNDATCRVCCLLACPALVFSGAARLPASHCPVRARNTLASLCSITCVRSRVDPLPPAKLLTAV